MSNFRLSMHTNEKASIGASVEEFGMEDRISIEIKAGDMTVVIFIPAVDRGRAQEISSLFNGMTCAKARRAVEAA